VRVDFREADIELALLHWLTRLLCKSHQLGMVFERFLLERDGSLWRGLASGAPGPQPNARGWWLLDVTACDLSVRQLAAGWEARCVFDFRRGPAAHREGDAGAQPPGSGPGAPH
jgi:SHS2 domain-containing protein